MDRALVEPQVLDKLRDRKPVRVLYECFQDLKCTIDRLNARIRYVPPSVNFHCFTKPISKTYFFPFI